MQPEVMAQLIQFGALGLLAVVIWYVMQQQSRLLNMQAETTKSLVAQIASLQETMLRAFIDAKDESVTMAKNMALMAGAVNGGGANIPKNNPT